MERRTIAVDFDGTIVDDQYPAIGRERAFALRTLKALQEKGFALILWTCREGAELEAAVEWCRERGLEFYGVNEHYDGEGKQEAGMRKLDADIYIDDRNIGGLPSWGEIYQSLVQGSADTDNAYGADNNHDDNNDNPYGSKPYERKPGLLKRLFGGG